MLKLAYWAGLKDFKVCISPEEEAIASKASAIHVFESVCLFVCPKHQKTKPIYKYVICLKSREGLTASMHKF